MPIETYNHTADTTLIEKIEFSVFSNQEVKRYSVINDPLGINIPEAYDNGEPKQGGLIDKRLGVTDQHLTCDTCGCMTNDCPGHFGHTELAEEVFHYGYLDIAKNVLNCICLQCSKLLITKNKEEIMETLGTSYGKNRFAKIKKITSNAKFCQRPDNNCAKPVGKISKEITKAGSVQLLVTYMVDSKQEDGGEVSSQGTTSKKKKNTEILTPARVHNIFKNIDDDDCRLMGFDPTKNRPENFIIKNFPIPPVAIRPSVRLEMLSSGPTEDGLTSKLADIVKDNGRLRKQKDKTLITGEESKYNQDYQQLLQYDIATYYDNESTLPKSEQKGSKASKSVSERLKGKTGRIRGNLMGKRVDFSARTVITSDPNLSLDELGVPIKIAMNVTFPEVVTPFNNDRLTKLVRNGRDVYPGANFVIPLHSFEHGKKSKIDLRYRKKSVKLHNGDIVERHIIDGDPVLFNRQPSLHKMSMMCHRIRVIKDESLNTFRLNVTVTTPYNADFDGDEMNMFVPQSVQTQLELANIADVKRQIITPRYSRPIIKFKQDTVLGTYKMTDRTKKIDYHDAMNLAMYCNSVDLFQIQKEETDTHKLYSLIIPNMINFSDGKVNIMNGKLLTGIMGDSILNQKIVYYSWDRHGPDTTKNFFDNAQRLVTNWLLMNGFSVGLGDATTDQYVIDDIKTFCEIKQMEVDKLITEMENHPDTLDADTFESNILSTLKASDGEITKRVYDHLKKNHTDNNFFVMIESKAKGSQGNIGQIIGGLGQNVLDFRRIKKKVNNRTLPHFFQNDDRAFARGFIPNSYYHGLTPKEFFFHHMTAREGMIDTAIKTADSGYLQRKLIKGMEDVMLTYDKTVRSGNNVIIQMIYGENNINQTHYKEVDIKLVNMSNSDVDKTFGFSSNEIKDICRDHKLDTDAFINWNKKLCTEMKRMRNDLRKIQMKARMNYITMQSSYQLPVNMNRIIEDAKNTERDSKAERPNPLYILHAIEYILRPDISKVNILSKILDDKSIKFGDQQRAKHLYRIALLEYLSPRRCIYEYKLSKVQFDNMVIEIIKSFSKACVEPGEMVGVLTAQSLGETLTQMTLIGRSKIHLKVINKKNNKISIRKTNIGDFINTLYEQFPNRIMDIPNHKNSTEFCLNNLSHEYYICGVTQNEKVEWNKISHLSKHPTNGNLLKIKTRTNRTVTTTKSHNFLKRTPNDGIIAVTSDNLKLKDRIPVARKIKYVINNKSLTIDNFEVKLDKKMGWLFGAYLAEGTLNGNCIRITNMAPEYYKNIYDLETDLGINIKQRNYQGEYGPGVDTSFIHKELANVIRSQFKCGSFNKVIPEFVHNANLDFVAGLLRGYFDGDGNVAVDRHIIRISSRSEELIKDVSILLLYFGIFGSLYEEKKSNSDTILYCLGIPHKYAKTFLDSIGSDIKEKSDGIKEIIKFSESEHQYNSEFIDKIPELGHIISRIGTGLKMPGNSRTYGVWERRNMSIGRRTLEIYVERFKERLGEISDKLDQMLKTQVESDIEYLKMISEGEVIWDEITEITEIDDPNEYVYDFTIPNNETFMVNDGVIVHNTLNTFHSSGVGVKGMQGIPRFREILSYSKKIQTPYMIIKLIPEVRADHNIAHKIEAYLKHTIFGNLIEHMDIIFDPLPENYLKKDNINKANIYYINGGSAGIENLPWLFRFTISRESMLENDISLLDIKTKFIKYWEDYNNDSSATKKKIILSKITNGCVLSNFDNSEQPIIHIRYDISNPDNYTLVDIGQYMLNKISIKGVATIEKVDRIDKQKVIEYDEDEGINTNSNEWVIYTTGIDLDKIKSIKQINFDSVYLNDIYATYLNFGIEAARSLIIRETDNLYNGSGNAINTTHLSLLADVMTNTGNITSIDRHGINRLDTDPLSRASFEKTVEQLIMASAFNEVDHMRSVSSRIMAGRCIKGGTGICDVIMNNELIENSEYNNQSNPIMSTNMTTIEENASMLDYSRQNMELEDNIFIPR
jgi:DNA-directed RNA polymerase II subunit RPB1